MRAPKHLKLGAVSEPFLYLGGEVDRRNMEKPSRKETPTDVVFVERLVQLGKLQGFEVYGFTFHEVA